MRPIWRKSRLSVICLSADHDRAPCESGWTDRDAVWGQTGCGWGQRTDDRANWRHLTNTKVKSVRGLRCDVSLPLAVATCCLFAVENFAASWSRTRRRNRLSGTKLQRVPVTAVKPRTGHGGQCPGRGPRGLETSASPHSRIETYKTKTNASTIIRDQCQGRDRAFVETRRPIYKTP